MRVAGLLVLLTMSGCYASHAPSEPRGDAGGDGGSDAALADAGACGGDTDVQVFLVRGVGTGAFLDLTRSAVVGFGECASGSIELGFDVGPPSTPPTVEVSIPIGSDAAIDREGDWPCTVRAHFGAEEHEESCVLTGRITGRADRGFAVSLRGMLGGVGYSVSAELRAPVCELEPCP